MLSDSAIYRLDSETGCGTRLLQRFASAHSSAPGDAHATAPGSRFIIAVALRQPAVRNLHVRPSATPGRSTPRRARPGTRHPQRAARGARRAWPSRADRRGGGHRQDRARGGGMPGGTGAGSARTRRALLRLDRDAALRPVGRPRRPVSPRRRLPAASRGFRPARHPGHDRQPAVAFPTGRRLVRRARRRPGRW